MSEIFCCTGCPCVADVLMSGLESLEYSGYDSAGIATMDDEGRIVVTKKYGKLHALRKLVPQQAHHQTGIGHLRWATHGTPSDVNSQPHFGGNRSLVIAQKGSIENWRTLKNMLEVEGYRFFSTTDVEVGAHLLDQHLGAILDESDDPLDLTSNLTYVSVMRATIQQMQIKGNFALAVMFTAFPRALFVYSGKNGPRLYVSQTTDNRFFVSTNQDAAHIRGNTRGQIPLGKIVAICPPNLTFHAVC